MFKNLKKNVEIEIAKKIRHILDENNKYIFLNRKSSTPISKFSIDYTFKRIVIPTLTKMPKYRFYMHHDNLFPAQDDPVLRYVPILKENTEYENLTLFNNSELSERPLDKSEQVNEQIMKIIFSKFKNDEMFKLKRKIHRREVTADGLHDKYRELYELKNYLDLSLAKLMEKWEYLFDKQREILFYDMTALIFYFCGICYCFDCTLHDDSDYRVLRTRKGESFPTKARRGKRPTTVKTHEPVTSAEIHGRFCDVNSKQTTEDDEYINRVRYIQKMFQTDACTKNLFLFYSTGKSSDCSLFTDTTDESLTKTYAPTSKHINMPPNDEVFIPCNHVGSCMNNKQCSCWTSKYPCEPSCLCRECDLYVTGCTCTICNSKCRCRLQNRECGPNCKHRCCINKHCVRKLCKKIYIGRSLVEGFGLFAAEYIKAGDFIIEYTGEVITNAEAERRGHFYEKKKISYLFDINTKDNFTYQTIDAMLIGNPSRFANHSKNPNIKATTLQVDGVKRIGFYAMVDIRIHTELCFNYQYKEEHMKKYNISG